MNVQFRSLFKKPYLLVFLNGFMIASLCYFQMERSYENQIYSAIKQKIDSRLDADDNQDSLLVKTMNTCYTMMNNRANVFGSEEIGGVKMNFIHPSTVDLMTAKGACGSYSAVLARMLKTAHFDVRIAQMKANGVYGAHNIVEAQTTKGWVVLDPTYNLYFTKPDHNLANFDDVNRNWNYYIRQVPANYDTIYRYEDVRYANWTKIPLVSPGMKAVLNLCIGRPAADKFCVRTVFMNVYTVWFYVFLLLYIPVFLMTLKRFLRATISFEPSQRRVWFWTSAR